MHRAVEAELARRIAGDELGIRIAGTSGGRLADIWADAMSTGGAAVHRAPLFPSSRWRSHRGDCSAPHPRSSRRGRIDRPGRSALGAMDTCESCTLIGIYSLIG